MTERADDVWAGYADVHESLWERMSASVSRLTDVYEADKSEMLRVLVSHLVYMGWKGPTSLRVTSEAWVLDALKDNNLLRSEQLEPIIRHLETKVRSVDADQVGHWAMRLVTELARQRGLREREGDVRPDFQDRTSGPPRSVSAPMAGKTRRPIQDNPQG